MISKIQALAFGAILLVCTLVFGNEQVEELEVVSVTPSGVEVPISRGEVIIEFNKNMVAFGQTDKDLSDVPVEITPELQCTWRWTSPNQLTCTHSDFLKYTTSYVVSIGSSFSALDGSSLVSKRQFSFRTASLGVYGRNTYWRSATRPIFYVSFSQPMRLSTMLQKVHIRDLKTSELLEVRAVNIAGPGMLRWEQNTSNFYLQEESGHWTEASESERENLLQSLKGQGIDRERYSKENVDFATKSWYLEPHSNLDPNTTYDLEVDSDVASIFATEPTTRPMHISRFKVYPDFEFLGLECLDTNGEFKQHLIRNTQASREKFTGCDPDEGITLMFTVPAKPYDVKYRSPLSPRPKDGRNLARARYYSSKNGTLVRISRTELTGNNKQFATDDDLHKVRLGYELQGDTAYELRVGFGLLSDVFGRRLRSNSTVKFRTGHMKPKLQIEPAWLVLNTDSDGKLPIDVANVQELRVRLATQRNSKRGWSVTNKKERLKLAANQVVSTTLGIGEWLSSRTGQFALALEPTALEKHGSDPEVSCIFGQVTPYHVHARIGQTSSVAWVTNLETGQVVPDASVALIETDDSSSTVLAEVPTNKWGIASLPGKAIFSIGSPDRALSTPSDVFDDLDCQTPFAANHTLWVDGPQGSSALPLAFSLGSPSRSRSQGSPHLSVWGHTAQGLYRPGQVIQYKIFVREQTDEGLRVDKNRRFRLVVTKRYDNVAYHENDIELSQFGTFHGEFTVPETILGNEGTLRFLVMVDNGESLASMLDAEDGSLNYDDIQHWEAFEVDVLDFDPATIRVEHSLGKEVFELGDMLDVTGRVDLISGGPFSNAPFLIETRLLSESFVSEHLETEGYTFVTSSRDRHRWTLNDFETESGATDAGGILKASLELEVIDVHYGSIHVSLGVQEDGGNVIWDSASAKYRSTDRFVGIRFNGEQPRIDESVSVDTVVVNPEGVPTNDRRVVIKFVRIDSSDIQDARQEILVHSCELSVENTSRACTMTPTRQGSYRAIATIETSDGRIQEASKRIYVQGRAREIAAREQDYVHFVNNHELEDRLFQAGEFASLVVEHSVPGSMALVTVERLGILDQWVTELEGTHDVIDIPIRQDYAPIVRVMVTVATANSVNKPGTLVAESDQQTFPNSWRRAVRLRVKDPTRQLNVQVSTDKEIYEPGEFVRVSVNVNQDSRTETRTPPATELAVAVVDQGVLEVSERGIDHFDPIQGLLETMDIDVEGYWLLREGNWVISGSYIAREGFDQGPRSNKDLTSLWMPNVETDDDGEATFEFKIGDRLTEWNIIVVAASTTEHFGLGQKSIKTNLGVEVRPVLPNLVTDGDAFDASFSVLNRTDSKRVVSVEIEAQGDVEPYLHSESISLEPFERRLVSARTLARLSHEKDAQRGKVRFLATASAGKDSDALEQEVPVHPRRPYFVSSLYGTSTKKTVSEPIEFPQDITDGTGYLEVQVTPSLIGTVEDRVAQVRDYPYQCWEQKLSSAIVAAQYSRLKQHMNVDWESAGQYIEGVLQSAVEYQSPNLGGFGYWMGESSHSDLYLSAYTALAFRWLMDAGYQVPEKVMQKLLEYLEEYTVYRIPDYLSRNKSVVPSMRLMLVNALVQHGKGDLDLVKKLYEENQNPNLFSIAQTLEAAISLEAPKEFVSPLVTRLTSSIGVSGDSALIHHGAVNGRNFMLSSTLKTTCSAISAFVSGRNRGKELISDEKLAELVRGVLFEWNHQKLKTNPHQSSFCLGAIAEYAEAMETVEDDFAVDVKLILEGQSSQSQFEQPTQMNGSNRSFTFSTSLKPEFVGWPGDMELQQAGDSRFYYKATLQYEPTEVQTEGENFGIDISKTYWIMHEDQWVELEDSHQLRRGDVVRVELYLDIRDQRDFVIVDDPVPGFLQPINLRLAKTNRRELRLAERDRTPLPTKILDLDDIYALGTSRWGFYNREIGNHSVRFASDFLPTGQYRLNWAGRVISTGEFLARPAHAEAMYSPEVYGNSRSRRIHVSLN
ncbi:MAG: hypothetical protein F4Z66_11560 [Gammaproteobacteria bacterium]|nr:hypothetical protein [Gammaproteobacteria bacterium]